MSDETCGAVVERKDHCTLQQLVYLFFYTALKSLLPFFQK